jgi:hypothetical protein
MSLFRRSPEPDRSIEYLCQLMVEQNSLLRELIHTASGRIAAAPRATRQPVANRIRTDSDVSRISRETILQEQFRKQEAEIAPWRTPASGQDSKPENPGIPPERQPLASPDLF